MSRVIFFDIDGTLLASGGAGQKAMELALTEEFRIEFPFEGILTAGRTDTGIVAEIFDRYDIAHTDDERTRFRNAYLDHLPGCLKSLSGYLLPGVRELLDRLSVEQNVVLALLTGNYSKGAWVKLRHFGLDSYFEFGGFGDIHEERSHVAKAARDAASDALGVILDGNQCCVVGDTPADIHCARAIGASAVAVATGAFDAAALSPHEPDHLLADFADVEESVFRILSF